MKRAPKTPALAKLAMLLLFAIATVAILDTTSISAQGILMPYETSIELTKDSSGHISGAQGSSGESTAQVYQELIELSGISNPESQTVDITAN